MSCLDATRCPLLSQPTVTVFTYLFLQSQALSLHHSSVSFSLHRFSYLRIQNQSFTSNQPLCFSLHSSFVVFSPQPCHFLFPVPYNIRPSYQFTPMLSSATQYLTHLCNSGWLTTQRIICPESRLQPLWLFPGETHCLCERCDRDIETHWHTLSLSLFDNVQTLSTNLGVITKRQWNTHSDTNKQAGKLLSVSLEVERGGRHWSNGCKYSKTWRHVLQQS